MCVCFLPFILDVKFVYVLAEATQEEGHRISHPPSICGSPTQYLNGGEEAADEAPPVGPAAAFGNGLHQSHAVFPLVRRLDLL